IADAAAPNDTGVVPLGRTTGRTGVNTTSCCRSMREPPGVADAKALTSAGANRPNGTAATDGRLSRTEAWRCSGRGQSASAAALARATAATVTTARHISPTALQYIRHERQQERPEEHQPDTECDQRLRPHDVSRNPD